MKRILKITGIGCGGLFGLVILLGIIGAATGGGSRSATPTAISVPKGKKGLVLSYQPAVIAGGYEVIRIALD